MRIGVFILFLVFVVILDTSLMEMLRIGGTVPGLAGTLAVFLVLAAPRRNALWACLAIGLLLDFNVDALYDGRPYHLIGPYTLGFLFGANLILPLRSMVFSRNPLTFGLLTAFFLLAVSIVYLALWQIRGHYEGSMPVWGDGSAVSAFGMLLLWAVYSGAIAIPMGWLLVRTTPLWGFTGSTIR
ncbi:MAG: hypothetical protein P8J45_05015 [Phycisphaerales bacterium]|jgi:rod shape-determining protein MreD|nr:hypothetical protein [Phycisphaerales bacterium]